MPRGPARKACSSSTMMKRRLPNSVLAAAGRRQNRASGAGQEPALGGCGGVAVPPHHGQLQPFAELFQASELVVDQGLEWRDVEDRETVDRLVRNLGQHRQEGGLCLASCRGRGDQHVPLPLPDLQDGPGLDLS